MACRGYFLALDERCTARLLACDSDDALRDVLEEFDMNADMSDECVVDKAWDGIHRCLTEGGLGSDDGTYPLNAVVLGGRHLYRGDAYIVCHNSAGEVREIAAALDEADLEQFAAVFWSLDAGDYGAYIDQHGLTYLLDYLKDVTAFYHRAATAGWSTVFVVDQ
ncbi:DUF1877 family protein [Actinoplanes subglobosus]|uniref:DUF1877 family protein n=1 Tax=Actinoplanes subglobosus TaxID=1547892 RepID=A0ABV8J322_9ACTN